MSQHSILVLPVTKPRTPRRGLPWGLASPSPHQPPASPPPPGPLLGGSGRGRDSRVVRNEIPEAGGGGSFSAAGTAPEAQFAEHVGKVAGAAKQRTSAHCSPETLQHQRGRSATRHLDDRGDRGLAAPAAHKGWPWGTQVVLPQQVENQVSLLLTAPSFPKTRQPLRAVTPGARRRNPLRPLWSRERRAQ